MRASAGTSAPNSRRHLKQYAAKARKFAAAIGSLPWEDIHVGPSDYVAWQNDNKVAFLRMEGQLFGGVPMNIELRLSVEDSPNSAGGAIDLIRCARVAKDRELAGPVHAAASAFRKHPPRQFPDDEAFAHLESFISGQQAG